MLCTHCYFVADFRVELLDFRCLIWLGVRLLEKFREKPILGTDFLTNSLYLTHDIFLETGAALGMLFSGLELFQSENLCLVVIRAAGNSTRAFLGISRGLHLVGVKLTEKTEDLVCVN